MIDLHTHILPGVDDGAKDPATSLRMLRLQREQGVDTVVLTPHFYGYRESAEQFLERRNEAERQLREAVKALPEQEAAGLPEMILGCEVAWTSALRESSCLEQLCIAGTRTMLLELPFTPWDKTLSRQIRDLMERTGITPVLAHLERYLKLQNRERVMEILELGLPVQISADAFLHLLSRGRALNALKDWAHVVASDCHDPEKRRPCLGEAAAVIGKKLGGDAAAAMEHCARELAGL